MFRNTRRPTRLAALAAVLVLAASAGVATDAHEGHGKPALLQTGDCGALGGAAFSLVGVGAEEDAGGLPIEAAAVVGPDSAATVTTSTSTVAATIDQIVTEGHAIVVYASDAAMETPIACGAVGGIQIADDLFVGLDPVGDEGQSGIALLRASGTDTTVTILLTAGSEHGHDATADDSPGDEADGTPEA